MKDSYYQKIPKIGREDGEEMSDTEIFYMSGCAVKKINTVIDRVNRLSELVEALVEENNVHESQIDELQLKTRGDLYTKTCRMDKAFAEENMERLQKKLDVTVHALERISASYPRITDIAMQEIARETLEKVRNMKCPT